MIPKDRVACDFPACRNFSDGGFCLRSKKAAEMCSYQILKAEYNAGLNRKDRLMIELLDLVRQGQRNRQEVRKEIRKELRRRSTELLEKMESTL